ncbi:MULTISPECIES: AEC family transporter [unclassified Acinetobacter]|uniref:AEC family transporter n=1 Tax=unclassified Acinetobacter TaxID=196816 RepID=UPI000A33B461|nr:MULTISPECIES: AEC family transporter [unclassified Acinetobacter]OTG71847.1 transporter [Acinetobacter sp. ANC 4218]
MNIVMALFPLIILIAMGYLLKQTRFVTDEFWGNSEKLNYFILFPSLLFLNLSHVELEMLTVSSMLGILILIILLAAMALFVAKKIYNIPVQRFGVYMQSQVRFNTYIGLSLMASLFGPKGMQMFAMLIAVAIPLVNILSVLALSSLSWNTLGKTVISITRNPLILGCIVGVGFNLLNLPLIDGIGQLVKLLAAMSLPLGLLSVGAALQFDQFKINIYRLLMNVFGRLLIMPILAFAVCQAFDLSHLERMILVVFFSLPTASASYILTRVYQGDHRLMAAVISLQTICFAVTFPALMLLLP